MLGYGERAGRDCDTFDGQENTELGIFLVQYHSSYLLFRRSCEKLQMAHWAVA